MEIKNIKDSSKKQVYLRIDDEGNAHSNVFKLGPQALEQIREAVNLSRDNKGFNDHLVKIEKAVRLFKDMQAVRGYTSFQNAELEFNMYFRKTFIDKE